MLETVIQCIEDSPNINFHQYFVDYMVKIQDSNIDLEVKQLLNNAIKDLNIINLNLGKINSMDKLVTETFERLESI